MHVPHSYIEESVQIALTEDIGHGDVTAKLIPEDEFSLATVIAREDAIICGVDWFDEVFAQLDPQIFIEWDVDDGDSVEAGQQLCTLSGSTRALLSGERTALNFLQTLSGTATIARKYADAVAGTDARVLDTRKTIPGLRMAQKYAVSCGGCENHRMGLYDAILIKENHIQIKTVAPGSVSAVESTEAEDQSTEIADKTDTKKQIIPPAEKMKRNTSLEDSAEISGEELEEIVNRVVERFKQLKGTPAKKTIAAKTVKTDTLADATSIARLD